MRQSARLVLGLAVILVAASGSRASAEGDLRRVGTVTSDALVYAVEAKTYGTDKLFVTSRGASLQSQALLGGVSVWNLSNPAAPVLQDVWRSAAAATFDDARVEGQDLISDGSGSVLVTVAQLAKGTGMLHVLDATSALRGGRLTELGSTPILYPTETEGTRYPGLHVKVWESSSRRRFALVTSPRFGNDAGGVVAIDITVPSQPKRVAAIAINTTFAEGIEVVGSYAYVGGAYSDRFVRLSLGGLLEAVPRLRIDAAATDARYNNMVSEYDEGTQLLYSASWCSNYPSCTTGGLLAFDATGPVVDVTRPLKSNITTEFHHANRVRLDGEIAYLPLQSAAAPGIAIIDISNPRVAGIGSGRRAWLPTSEGRIYALAAYNGYVYAVGVTTGTMFIMKAVAPVVDAIVSLDNDYTYAFSGDRFSKYQGHHTQAAPWQAVAGYGVKPIANHWGLGNESEQFNYGFDAAERLKNGVFYGFRGSQWVRYADGGTPGVVDAGYPKNICPAWGDLPLNFCQGFDSVAYVPSNDRLYVTKGSQYIRYENGGIGNDWSGPYSIAGNWGALPQEYLQGFDSMTVVGGNLYVFRGATFTRYANQGVGNVIEGTFPISLWGALVRTLN